MATASTPSFTVTKETTNFARLSKLLIDGATHVLKEVFDNSHKPQPLQTFLNKNHATLKKLKKGRLLTSPQWDKLYPTTGPPDSSGFDISLLCVLLRNICNLKNPTAGNWNTFPLPKSTTTEDDLVRIRLWRNELIAHTPKAALSDTDFIQHWDDIERALIRLGGTKYQPDIDDLKIVSMDANDEKYYIRCLEEWEKDDEIMKALDKLTETLEEVRGTVDQQADKQDQQAQKFDEKLDEVRGKVDEIGSKLQTSKDSAPNTSIEDVEHFSQRLRTAVQSKLESDQEYLNIAAILKKFKLEDIFTNMMMSHGPRVKSKSSQSHLHGSQMPKQINEIAEIFLDMEKKNPKSILIKGNPGVGKTLFCRKLLHAWAEDEIFNTSDNNPEIKFPFLIPLRQLNEFTEEKMNITELLQRFSMLDEMDDSVIKNIINQRPEELLIIIDGYDEYKERQTMDNPRCESSFSDNPTTKMPIPALLSKLVKNKMLPNAIVMVTSRPGEADEMKTLHFDRYVEIIGFSEDQVTEYVTKYFKNDKEMQIKALDAIKTNEFYLRFGRVPLMCVLMCAYMELHHSTSSSECFPETLTAFYSEVVKCMEENCNKAIQEANLDPASASLLVDKTLDKMAELAADSLLVGKYTFSEEDLQKLQLSELEMTCLKSSSLLSCENSVTKPGLSLEVRREYSFSHTTIQEYFAARRFVDLQKIPATKSFLPFRPAKPRLSSMTLQFMAGCMDPVKHKRLMKKLLKYIVEVEKGKYTRSSVSFSCLYEFGDVVFNKSVVQENKHNTYWNSDGRIVVYNIDYKVVLMLVDIINRLSEQQPLPSPVPHRLTIFRSPFTLLGLDSLLTLLTKPFCIITELWLVGCNINDEQAECLSKHLPATKLTWLDLDGNKITDNGVLFIVNCCSQLECLGLAGNKITDNGVLFIVNCCSQLECLDLRGNNITDREHVRELFKVKHPGLELYI